jgi:hypothetical protein
MFHTLNIPKSEYKNTGIKAGLGSAAIIFNLALVRQTVSSRAEASTAQADRVAVLEKEPAEVRGVLTTLSDNRIQYMQAPADEDIDRMAFHNPLGTVPAITLTPRCQNRDS